MAMNEEEIKYCKIGNASAIAAIIGALFFWGLTFEFAVGKFAFFTILPLVSMIKSAKQKAEIMRELETTRDFTIED